MIRTQVPVLLTVPEITALYTAGRLMQKHAESCDCGDKDGDHADTIAAFEGALPKLKDAGKGALDLLSDEEALELRGKIARTHKKVHDDAFGTDNVTDAMTSFVRRAVRD